MCCCVNTYDSLSLSKKVISLLTGCFLVCWTPFIVSLFFKLDLQSTINADLYKISFILMVLNSIMNPLIYAWKMKGFKDTFLEYLTCGFNGNAANAISDVLVS